MSGGPNAEEIQLAYRTLGRAGIPIEEAAPKVAAERRAAERAWRENRDQVLRMARAAFYADLDDLSAAQELHAASEGRRTVYGQSERVRAAAEKRARVRACLELLLPGPVGLSVRTIRQILGRK